jgi:hypothetical protein
MNGTRGTYLFLIGEELFSCAWGNFRPAHRGVEERRGAVEISAPCTVRYTSSGRLVKQKMEDIIPSRGLEHIPVRAVLCWKQGAGKNNIVLYMWSTYTAVAWIHQPIEPSISIDSSVHHAVDGSQQSLDSHRVAP